MAIQNLRSSQAHRRAIPSLLSAGQICINTNEASPGLFFKDSNGDLVKVGPVHIGTSAPNSSPDSLGAGSLVTGTVYQILTLGTSDFTAVGASANTVGTIFTATGTTTGTGTVSTGVQGNEKGEQWLDTTGGAYDLKIYDGSAWRSQAGEFVNVTGDTMTGALGVVAGTASAPGVFFSGDTNTGLLAPAADSVAITTGGTQRMRIESSGYAKFNSGFVFVQSSASGSSDSDGLALISDTNADAYVWNYENTTLRFGTNATERMRIDSSGRLLVNTTTEGHSDADNLTIADSSKAGITIRNTTTTGDGAIFFSDATSGTAEYAGYIEYGHSTNHLRFATASAEQMRIDSSGNVGIGNSAPAYKLSVLTTGTSDTSLHLATTGGASDNGDATNSIRFTGGNNTRWANAKYEAFTHIFNANGAERLRLDSAGRLLVGSSSDTGNAKALFRGGTGTNIGVVDIQANINSTGIGSGNPAGYLRFKAADSGTSNYHLGYIGCLLNGASSGSDDIPGALTFGTASDGAGSVTERMRIDSSGRLLLGTTTVGFNTVDNLTIADSGNCGITIRSGTSSSSSIYFADGTSGSAEYEGFIDYQHSSNALRFGSGGGQERMRIDSSGRVLINHTADTAPASYSSKLQLCDTSYQGASLLIRRDQNSPSAPALLFTKTRSATKGGSTAVQNGDLCGQIIWYAGDGTDANSHVAFMQAVIDGTPGSNDMPGRLSFHTTADGASLATERMRINSSGNVGVGTTSINNKFVIASSGSNPAYFHSVNAITGTGGNDGIVMGMGDATNAFFWNYENGSTVFATNATERMRLDSAGRLGLGTNNPAYLLDLAGVSNPQIRLNGTSSSNQRGLIFAFNGTQFGQIGQNIQSGELRIRSGESGQTGYFINFEVCGNDAARIDSAGNVGIGTSSPTALLQVGSYSGNNGVQIAAGTGSTSYIHFGDAASGLGEFAGYIQYTHSTNALQFGTNSTERMRIDSNGDLILNATTADVGNAGVIVLRPNGNGTSKPFVGIGTTATNNSSVSWAIYATTIPQYQFYVGHAGTVFARSTSISALSDEREKENIRNLDTGLSEILQLQPRRFDWKNGSGQNLPGFVAQEVETVLPDLVDDYRLSDTETRKALKMGDLVPTLVKALQETHAKIETLEQRLADAGIA